MTQPIETYPLPPSIATVKVKGQYRGPDGRGLQGTVTFTGPGLLTFPDADLFIAGPVVARLDEFGSFEVTLPATDNEGMNPSDWSYTVKENLTGVTGARTFALLLPKDTAEIDLADVAPADPLTPNYVPVPGPQGETGPEGESAYDVAVTVGFIGTEAEWIASLKGAKGDTGAQGLKGDTGATGATGAKGDPGSKVYKGPVGAGVGVDGDVSINTTNGGLYWRENGAWVAQGSLIGPQGPAGPTGPEGPQGPQGPPGADGTGSGTVTAVNGVLPAAGGNVTLTADDLNALPDTGLVSGGFLTLDSPTGDYRGLSFTTNAGNRWVYQVDNGAETGADAGSNFELSAWSDAGEWKSTVLFGDRATTNVGIGTNGLVPGAKLTVAGGTALTNVTAAPATPTGAVVAYAEGGALKVVTPTSRFTVVEPVPLSTKGVANGVASLGADGKVPTAQLPAATSTGVKNAWTPQALGFEAWSCDPYGVANPVAKYLKPNRLYFVGINITESTTVDRIVLFARGYGGVSSNRYRAALYRENGTGTGTKVVESASVALTMAGQEAGTLPAQVTNHIGAVPVTIAQTVLTPGRYWVAFSLVVGGTADFAYFHVQNEAPIATANFFMTNSPWARAWYLEGQTNAALPTTANQAASTSLADHDIPIVALANV